jgi:hypothetical protein
MTQPSLDAPGHVMAESAFSVETSVIESTGVTHLRYRMPHA